MKKEDIASLVIYFIMIIVAIIVGLTAVQDAIQNYRPHNFNPFLLVILIIVVSLIVNIVLLELLHVLGAKVGGYAILSVNILGICFEKKNGAWKLGFKQYDGLTGETKVAPRKEKHDLKPFVYFPIFGYAAEIATSIVVYSFAVGQPSDYPGRWLAIAAILTILLSSMIALYNLVPLKLDSMTDGYRLVLLSKPINKEAYDELLRIEDLYREGKEPETIKVFEEITEFTANLNLISVYKYLNEAKYDEASKLLDLIIANKEKIDPKTYNRILAQKLYVSVFLLDEAGIKKLYEEMATTEFRRFIANDLSMESIRAYILIAGMIEESEGEVNYAKSRYSKALKLALPSRIVVEEKLFKEALNIVYTKHPKWNKENSAN